MMADTLLGAFIGVIGFFYTLVEVFFLALSSMFHGFADFPLPLSYVRAHAQKVVTKAFGDELRLVGLSRYKVAGSLSTNYHLFDVVVENKRGDRAYYYKYRLEDFVRENLLIEVDESLVRARIKALEERLGLKLFIVSLTKERAYRFNIKLAYQLQGEDVHSLVLGRITLQELSHKRLYKEIEENELDLEVMKKLKS